MNDPCSRKIRIVRVIDAAEELAVLQALKASGKSPDQADAKVTPVLDGLISTVCRIAATHRYPSQIVDARDFLANFPQHVAVHGDADPRVGRELAVLPLADVGQHAVLLTEHLSGGSVLRDLERNNGFLAQFHRAVVLFSPRTPADEFCRTLTLLSQQDIPFSVLPWDNSNSGRLSLLKALLFPTVEIRDVDQIEELASQAHATVDERRSGSTANTTKTLADRDQRILLFSAHGNSVDLGGRGVIICPRGEPKPREDMAGLYPCFGDGRCFRQPLFGRSPSSSEGLMDPALFCHPLVLLLGCGTFPIGDMPFDHRSTILWRMAGSDTLAAVATLGIFYHDLNVETALLSLLLDGHELGEAVRAFNAWHRTAYGRTSPAKEGYGPVVAVGHPGLRLKSCLIRELGSASKEEDPISIPSDVIRFSGNGLAIFKIRCPSRADQLPRALYVPRPLKGAAVSVVFPHQNDEAFIFVSLQSNATSGAEQSVELLSLARDTFERDLATLRDSLSYLVFWRLLLADAKSPMVMALGRDGERLAANVSSLELEPILLGYLSAHPFARDGVFPTSSAVAAHNLVMDRWCTWQRLMLEAACLYVQRTGGFLFHLWEKFYDRSCSADCEERCPSCLRETVWLLYRSQMNPLDQHRIIHCPVCGVIGELPRAIAVHTTESIRLCRGSDTLVVGFEIQAERLAAVYGFVTLIREGWFHAVHDTAEPIEVIVDPGSRRTFSITLAISPGLPPGLYPLTLVGVLNAGLVQLRCHVSIVGSIGFELARTTPSIAR
jgi:hypothetical protein